MRIPLIKKCSPWLSAALVFIAFIVSVLLIRPTFEVPKNTTLTSTTSHTWVTSRTFHGPKDLKTTAFTVTKRWRIVWSCDASSTPYNLSIVVYDAFGSVLDIAVNTTCHDYKSGIVDEHKGELVFLQIYSYTGTWHLDIQEMK